MVPQILVNVAFVLLVLACVLLILRAVTKAWHGEPTRGRAFAIATALLLGWLGLTAVLAFAGVLAPSTIHPPPNAALLVVVLVTVCVVTLGPIGRRLVARIDAPKLITFQMFRIPVELILWAWAVNGVGPRILTFEGRNFDILVGLTALPVAYFVARKPNKGLIVGWNIAGMIILGVVLVHAVLAGPSPIQQFFDKPDSSFVARWPYVWLPAVLVPLAYAGHLLSIRGALQTQPATAPKLQTA